MKCNAEYYSAEGSHFEIFRKVTLPIKLRERMGQKVLVGGVGELLLRLSRHDTNE